MRCRLLLSMIALLVLVAPAFGQRPLPGAGALGRPIRLEGYWGRTRNDPGVLAEVSVGMTGRKPRNLGVTAVQAYHPEEEGPHIFRFTSDHPVTLLVRGDEDTVRRFMEAPPDARIRVFGTYTAGSGLFVLGSVELGGER